MKPIPGSSAALLAAFLAALSVDVRAVTIIDDTQICTIYDSTFAWDMTTTRTRNESRSGAPFAGSDILDLKTFVFSDDGTSEVFTMARQPGNIGVEKYVQGNPVGQKRGKFGGYSQLTWWSTYNYEVRYDRGPNDVGAENTYSSTNFYTWQNVSPTAARPMNRWFLSTAPSKKRASMKIDYACNTPTALGFTAWRPLNGWNMRSETTRFIYNPLLTYGISLNRIVDMDVAIHSDPADPYYPYQVEVDNLQHSSQPNLWGNPYGRYRGGIFWLGRGCTSTSVGVCGYNGSSSTDYRMVLYVGPGVASTADTASHYRRGSTWLTEGGTNRTYTGTAQNRGWVKIQYTGPKSSTKVPYAMKTKVVLSDPWNMTVDPIYDIDLWYDLKIAANRISGLSATIVSDPVSGDGNRTVASNFHRPRLPGTRELSGGVVYFNGDYNILRLAMVEMPGQTPSQSFYDKSEYSTGQGARARVTIDYLAGACTQGPTGYQVDAIPSGPNRTGDCDGTSQPFTLTGTGDGNGVTINDGNTADAFTFFSKDAGNTGTKILSVRLDDIATYGQGGISFRVSKAKGSAHATLYMDANGILRFVTRNGTGNANVEQAIDYLSFPIWIALQQSGNTFTARYNTSLSTSHPGSVTSWTQLGSTVNLGSSFSGEMYRIGMTVSGHDYFTHQTQDVQMRAFTESN